MAVGGKYQPRNTTLRLWKAALFFLKLKKVTFIMKFIPMEVSLCSIQHNTNNCKSKFISLKSIISLRIFFFLLAAQMKIGYSQKVKVNNGMNIFPPDYIKGIL